MSSPQEEFTFRRTTGERQTSLTHPGYKLTPEDRIILGWMLDMNLWSITALAREFGISRKAVANYKR